MKLLASELGFLRRVHNELHAVGVVMCHVLEKERPDFIVFGFTLTHIAMIISESLGALGGEFGL